MIKTTNTLTEEDVWKPYLPALAPLPDAFIRHIFANKDELKPYLFSEPRLLFDQTWFRIQQARQRVSFRLVPAVAVEMKSKRARLTPRWLRKNFASYAGRSRLPTTTVQGWQERNLLRQRGYSSLEPNSIAAIYMMRYLFKDDYKFWLPHEQEKEAPWFYVWGIQPNEVSPPQMYRYPLDKDNRDIKPNTLLYTQWIGASWYPGFVNVPGVGALAWGKTQEYAGSWYWDISEEQMSEWDSSFIRSSSVKRRLDQLAPIMRQTQGFPDAEEYYHISRTHRLADMLLEQIGEPLLAAYIHHYFSSEKAPTKPFMPF